MFYILMVFGFLQVFWVLENIVTSHYWWGTVLSVVSGILCFWGAYRWKKYV